MKKTAARPPRKSSRRSGTTSAEALLGMLSLGPLSGYQLRKLIAESIGNFWTESYGQIYPTLKCLTDQGLVTAKSEPGKGAAARKIYTLTKAGEERLREWLSRPPQLQVPRNELLLKMFFGRLSSLQCLIGHLRTFRAVQIARLQQYEATQVQLKEKYSEHPDLPFWLMTVNYGLHEARALLAWSEETIGQSP